jgi:hypothetical protein
MPFACMWRHTADLLVRPVSEPRACAETDASAEDESKHRARAQHWSDKEADTRANDKADPGLHAEGWLPPSVTVLRWFHAAPTPNSQRFRCPHPREKD